MPRNIPQTNRWHRLILLALVASCGERSPQVVTADENLIAHVARATCLTYRLDPRQVPDSEVRLYVDELIALYQAKPNAMLRPTRDGEQETVASSVRFCADELDSVAADQASKLRSALNGPTE